MLLFGTKKSIKMKIFLAVTPEKTIPEIADSFNPALNDSLSLLCAFINYSLWKEVPNRIKSESMGAPGRRATCHLSDFPETWPV